MKHQVFSEELVAQVVDELKVANLEQATIGEVLLVASRLEELVCRPTVSVSKQRKLHSTGEWGLNTLPLPVWQN